MPGMLGETATDRIDMGHLPAQVAALITRLQRQVQAQAREIAWAHAKLEKVNFELARLKRWKFGAKTEAMTAQQRALFQDTLAEDEASLRARLAELQRGLSEAPKTPKAPRAKPRRQALPEHLERVEHRHEPTDTTCPSTECGRPMPPLVSRGGFRAAARAVNKPGRLSWLVKRKSDRRAAPGHPRRAVPRRHGIVRSHLAHTPCHDHPRRQASL